MLEVVLEPHQCDPSLRQIFLAVHPVTGMEHVRVGYCRPSTGAWSLIVTHGLHDEHIDEIDDFIMENRSGDSDVRAD